MDWRKLMRRIPATVKIAPGITYQVTWQKKLVDTVGNDLYGSTDYENKIITIELGLSPKQAVVTYIHECCHAFSNEHGIGLTETQIQAIEKTIPYFDGMFEKGNK